VNDGIEIAKGVHLSGNAFHLRDAGEVADDDCLGLRHSSEHILAPLFIASMQYHSMSLLDEKFGRHSAKPVS
jgi:hypothetical protein